MRPTIGLKILTTVFGDHNVVHIWGLVFVMKVIPREAEPRAQAFIFLAQRLLFLSAPDLFFNVAVPRDAASLVFVDDWDE